MSSRKRSDLFRQLSFRLTLWYGIIFAIGTLLLLLVFYTRVVQVTREAVDEELAEEAGEFAVIMAADGLSAVVAEMAIEEASEAPGDIFLRLLSPQGEVLATTDPAPWGGSVPVTAHGRPAQLRQSEASYETLDLDNRSTQMRTVTQSIGPQVILQVGISLEESEAYLDIFRQLLLWMLLPLVLLAGVVGWFMARQALTDVDAVTRTAEEIARGNSQKRVKVRRHFAEIDRLAASFNAMVDQLHALLGQMREMTDNIAHDLRSPMTRIRGYAEMTLLGDSSPDDFREMAVNTVEECDNLIAMINTMLDIAEAESGIAPVATEAFDLAAIVDDALSLYGNVARDKQIDLHRESPLEAVIVADRAKYQRMVGNLLENAIKYTPPGGQVTVRVVLQFQEARIEVSDTGRGIAAEELGKIFQRFYRCDVSRSEAGMGLGLSLAKALAESVGGSLTVRSALHRGSTFTLCLPTGASA
ncbi:MAG: ATP-binding protein [Desulfosarcinaceae bacterium]|nr:ATP-binding protein [Desulfosarcinaceae bacterium]